MKKINTYKKLETKADKFLHKHDNVCQEMLGLIAPILDLPKHYDCLFVMHQAGDGYVLVTDIRGGTNTPVDKIIQWFEKTGEKINEEVLVTLSI